MLTCETRNIETDPVIILDSYLAESLIYLRDVEVLNKGVVSAAIIDGDRTSFGIPTPYEDTDNWYHAERNAVRNFYERYGVLPSSSASIAVSLSPCTENRKARHREGVCCSRLLLGGDSQFPDLNIKRVHVGFVDPWQVKEFEEYKEMGFNMSVTQDPKLREACEKLFEYFTDHYGEDKQEYINRALEMI
jgi:pyrimidine deaminase RibD-like protein